MNSRTSRSAMPWLQRSDLVVLLARHGETEANRAKRISGQWDTPLSVRGLEQACALAQVMTHEPLTAIYASALDRTVTTAQLTAQGHGLPVNRVPQFNEVHLGELQGRALDGSDPDAECALAAWQFDRERFVGHGVECYEQFRERVQQGLRPILAYAAGTVMIVGHRNTNEVIVSALLGSAMVGGLPVPLNVKNKYVYRLQCGDAGVKIETIRLGGESHGRRYEGWKQ